MIAPKSLAEDVVPSESPKNHLPSDHAPAASPRRPSCSSAECSSPRPSCSSAADHPVRRSPTKNVLPPEGVPLPSADAIARTVFAMYDVLPKHGKPQGDEWTVLAGVVLEETGVVEGGDSQQQLRCVCLATGTRCVSASVLEELEKDQRDLVVSDCHAEVLARRAFRAWMRGGTTASDGGETTSPDGASASSRFHFYSSELPCGDATLCKIVSAPTGDEPRLPDSAARRPTGLVATGAKPALEEQREHFTGAAQLRNTLRTKPVRSDFANAEPSKSYCCSDKICRWNHCGWAPTTSKSAGNPIVFMSTISISGDFDEPGVADALFGRAVPRAADGSLGTSASVVPPAPQPAVRRSAEVFADGRGRGTATALSGSGSGSCGPRPTGAPPPTCGYSVVWVEGRGKEVLLSATGLKQGGDQARKSKRDIRKFASTMVSRAALDLTLSRGSTGSAAGGEQVEGNGRVDLDGAGKGVDDDAGTYHLRKRAFHEGSAVFGDWVSKRRRKEV